MAVAVQAGDELLRPGETALRHLRADHAGLGHPALDVCTASEPSMLLWKPPPQRWKAEGQRMQGLPRRQLQDARGRRGGREDHRDARRVEAVVLRFR